MRAGDWSSGSETEKWPGVFVCLIVCFGFVFVFNVSRETWKMDGKGSHFNQRLQHRHSWWSRSWTSRKNDIQVRKMRGDWRLANELIFRQDQRFKADYQELQTGRSNIKPQFDSRKHYRTDGFWAGRSQQRFSVTQPCQTPVSPRLPQSCLVAQTEILQQQDAC